MDKSERPRFRQPAAAHNTLNRGGESATSKRITVVEILKKEKFMGVPNIIATPVIIFSGILSIGYLANKAYQDIPPVHRAIDKAWDVSLETIGLRSNQEGRNRNDPNSSASPKIK